MWINLLCFVLASAFCWPLTLAFRHLGRKMRIYDMPGSRHVNGLASPRLGGVPVFISFLLALCAIFYVKDFFHWNLPQTAKQSLLLPLLCGATCVWLTGLFDDIWHLRARYKLLVQIAVAAGAYSLGLQIHAIHFPVWGTLNLGDYSSLFTVLWIVGTINAINLIDGIDGLCSSVVLCAFLGIFRLSILFGSDMGTIISCTLIGCVLTFLIFFNFPQASVFLGDSGAYFLGFMIAATPVFIASKSSSPGVFHVSFITFMIVPFLDTCLAIVRRLILGVPLSTPDRGHLHHRLLDKGYTHKRITLTVSSISFIFVAIGVMMAAGNRWQIALALIISVVAAYLLLRLCDINSFKDLKRAYAPNVSKTALLKKYAPSFFYDLTRAGDWTQAQKILDEFSWNTKMHTAKITRQKNGSHDTVWDWRARQDEPSRRQSQLCKTYEVPHDDVCYKFHFCWNSERSSVRSDTDALLEIVSEIVGQSCHEKISTDAAK